MIAFKPFNPNVCCLCGSSDKLTGEHKIKASALRSEFGTQQMAIGRFGEAESRLKILQSAKSKSVHFNSRMCSDCNSKKTQGPDREFDLFHKRAREAITTSGNPADALNCSRYAAESEAYLNLFRYFSKLLCCQMAEIGAPRRQIASRFATGASDANCVWLAVDKDWTYENLQSKFGEQQYAAHGGLIIYANKFDGNVNAFHSTLTVGPIRYVFFSRLNEFEQFELKWYYANFYEWCRERAFAHLKTPMTKEDRLRAGLQAESDESASEDT